VYSLHGITYIETRKSLEARKAPQMRIVYKRQNL